MRCATGVVKLSVSSLPSVVAGRCSLQWLHFITHYECLILHSPIPNPYFSVGTEPYYSSPHLRPTEDDATSEVI